MLIHCIVKVSYLSSALLVDVESSSNDGRPFTLDDVFNDTFHPKLYSATWTSGECVCMCVFLFVCSVV